MCSKTANLTPSIVTENLSKQYIGANHFALENLSISIYPGEVYGFLGPNGAGKSTAIRLLMDFIRPTNGRAEILSLDTIKDGVAIKNSVGYLAGDMAMYPKMTGRQYLMYMADLQPSSSKAYTRELVKRMKVDMNKKIGELSRGNKQKIGIVQAFMHKPAILILDEPTSGLDPLMQEEFYALVSEAKQRGATVFMSSHILSEVQKICDRVGIIRDGKLVSEQNIAEMNIEAAQTFDIYFADKVPLAALKKIKGVEIVSSSDRQITIHMHAKLAPLFALLARHDVLKIDAQNLDLETVFMKYYGEVGDKNA